MPFYNINFNHANATVTAANMTSVKGFLSNASGVTPFILNLTAEEKRSLMTMNVDNKVFAEDALTVARNNPTLVPPMVNVADWERDYNIFNQMEELILLVDQYRSKLRDTQMLAGAEAYAAARALYKYLEMAKDMGVSGADTAYRLLEPRFEKSSTSPTIPDPQQPE